MVRCIILFPFFLLGLILNAIGQQSLFNLNRGNIHFSAADNGGPTIRNLTVEDGFHFPVSIQNELEGCTPQGKREVRTLQRNGIEFSSRLVKKSTGDWVQLIERFTPGRESIHVEVEIRGLSRPFSAPIITNLSYDKSKYTRVWMPWGDPRIKGSEKMSAPLNDWKDPLIARDFFSDTLFYGMTHYGYHNLNLSFYPSLFNLISIPMFTVMETDKDKAVSVIVNPDDEILDLDMVVKEEGKIQIRRLFHKISDKNTLRFSFDVITHEAGWRGGLRWMSRNYPEYFNPTVPQADSLSGTAAYSSKDVPLNLEELRKMNFKTNWKASFDFPYMGMFLPPVNIHYKWKSFAGDSISIQGMEDYASKMREFGFYVLNYFNVTEFGANVQYPLPKPAAFKEEDLWKNGDDYLYVKLRDAILPVSPKMNFLPNARARTKRGGFYYTWENGIIMDCGEPSYRNFLLDQAQKHIQLLPSTSGICIDRLDWLRMYNEERDDNISWFDNRPARSLIYSWKNLMSELGPMMHKNNKVIFVNNHNKRLDLLKEVDGIFDEFTFLNSPLNLTALLCINKPALGWTSDSTVIKAVGADNFFQKYLYMGVYPMAPFPGNDHSIAPGEWTNRQYEDYGSLFSVLEGKKWILEANCIEVKDNKAKANLFKTFKGYAIPVVYGGNEHEITLRVRNIPQLEHYICKAIYPGSEKETVLQPVLNSEGLTIKVPLSRSCAMVLLQKPD